MTPPVPERPALFLDFDGTLVDIADAPDHIAVSPELKHLLEQLVDATDGAVAVVTGRQLSDVDSFLGLPLAGAGLHGLERRSRPGAEVETEPAPPEIDVLRQRLTHHKVLGNGVKLEDKGAGLVLHYRAAPDRRDEVVAAMDEALEGLDVLHVIHGKMVLEAKRKGFDKGAAVNAFMTAPPFEGRVPIFLGDDVTDEDGMRAAIAAGGYGIKVGDGDTLAKYRMPDVASVHAWLGSIASGS